MQKKPAVCSQEKKGFVEESYEWIEMMVLSLVIVVFVFSFLFRVVLIDGPSMNPTLWTDYRVIVSNIFYTPQNGDVVVFSLHDFADPFIKRVIAVEGQTVDFDVEKQCLILDGQEVYEDYINGQMSDFNVWYSEDKYPLTVPDGYIFVMGDNRNSSLDSRYNDVGLVDVRRIIGRAIFKIYPLAEIGTIE